VSNFEQPVARLGGTPIPDTHAAWSKPRNPKRVHVSLGFNLPRDSVLAQENKHIQTLAAEFGTSAKSQRL